MVASDPRSSAQAGETIDADYNRGMKHLDQQDWQAALTCFNSVLERTDHFDQFFSLYISAYGLAKVMTGDNSGLNQCRQAVFDEPKRADLYVNLAKACLELRQRKKAVDAIAKGLRIAPQHAGLQALKADIGYRRRPTLPFLSRDNPINRFIGRKTYRR